jgi:hypothetical protein
MKLQRNLYLFCAADFILSCLLAALYPQACELRSLVSVLLYRLGTDFTFFMDKAWSVFRSGEPLYSTLFFDQHIKFIYPPSSLFLYGFFSLLHIPEEPAVGVLVFGSFLGTLFCAGEILKLKISEHVNLSKTQCWRISLCAAFLGALFFPIVNGTLLGNIQTLLTFLWTLAVLCWMKQQKGTAGVLLAMVCVFKPMFALFLLWAAIRKEWRFLVFFFGSLVAIQAVAIVLFGLHDEIDYLRLLSFLGHRGEAFFPNQSINGLLERWTHNAPIFKWSFADYPPYRKVIYIGTVASSTLLLVFGLIFPVLRKWKDRTLDLIFFGMVSTLSSPIVWHHHYGYFFVGLLYCLPLAFGERGTHSYWFAAIFLVLSNIWPTFNWTANTVWNPLMSYDVFAGIGFLLLIAGWLDSSREKNPTLPTLSNSGISTPTY